MITLGLNAAFHDSAAALVIDGVPVAASEEERFSRIKHAKRPLPFSAWELPFNAIADCLRQAGITLGDVDHVAYSFDPAAFAGDRGDLQLNDRGSTGSNRGPKASIALPLRPGAEADPSLAAWDSPWDPLFLAYVVNAPGQLADGAPHHLKQQLLGSGDAAVHARTHWRWHNVGHHLCHQASAFLAAPFDRCAVMTLDGRGERATTTYGVWRDDRYTPLGEVHVPHSLGMLYERATEHLGFLHSSDEYKVMALAAMGQPLWADVLSTAVVIGDGGQFRLSPIDFSAFAGPARVPGTPLAQRQFDLASSLQQVLERKVLQLAEWLREASGERQLAMAGGVALNCLMNSRLRDEGPFEAVWVQPAAGDAGTALGAALWVDGCERLATVGSTAGGNAARTVRATGDTTADTTADTTVDKTAAAEATSLAASAAAPAPAAHQPAAPGRVGGTALAPRRWVMQHPYLGPAWSDAEIAAALRWAKLDFDAFDDEAALVERTAALLAAGNIIGWYQGRMEWGPRALGARSIIASPADPQMQARLNELKDREDFRPVAPAVTAEAFADWFTPADANGGSSPFMLFTHQALPHQLQRIPSACHSDGSARVQTVHAETNPRFHALLRAFERKSGLPVLVNTSFNVRGQPIVCSPKDAIEAYFGTPLDALVMGNCLLVKPQAARPAAT